MKRNLKGAWLIILVTLSLAIALFHLYTGAFGTFTPLVQRSVHLGFALAMTFLLYSGRKDDMKHRPGVIDVVLCLLTIVFTVFFVLQATDTMQRVYYVTPLNNMQIIMGLLLFMLMLEAVRRTCGLALTVVVVAALSYAKFGAYLSGVFGHPGYNIKQMVDFLIWTDQGVFGLPLGVSATYVALFVILGGLMTRIGISDLFRDIAVSASAKTIGGPAKIAVIFSGLLGMTSGSSAANVYGSGNFTIPLMKDKGYPSSIAGGIEATASCGGQILPPVMGAAAFVMAEFLGVSYAEIMLHAILPAFLYYVGIFASAHVISLKLGMEKPQGGLKYEGEGVFKRLYMLAPLFILVFALVGGLSSMTASYYGVVAAIVVGFLRMIETRLFKRTDGKGGKPLDPKELLSGLYLGGTWLISMALATAAAGVVVGVLAMSGLGMAFVGILVNLMGDKFLFVAFFVMIATILLGMGIPTTTAYILGAAFAAPALVKLGTEPIVAHFFVFYFAVFANITPPVAIASYAAASIAGSDIMKTSWQAIKIGISAMIIPYLFLINPALLGIGTASEVIVCIITGAAGVIVISFGVFGWFNGNLNVLERSLLIVAGISLMYPDLIVSICGAVFIGGYYLFTKIHTSKKAMSRDEQVEG